jgi:hypothetical protein
VSESPLEQAFEHYGGRILGTHGRVKANCCLHDDGNASATVDLETGKWWCFAGCGHGDLYDLIGIAERVSEFPEQKRIAAEKFGDTGDGVLVLAASPLNPNPRKSKPGRKGAWKPSWLR